MCKVNCNVKSMCFQFSWGILQTISAQIWCLLMFIWQPHVDFTLIACDTPQDFMFLVTSVTPQLVLLCWSFAAAVEP